MDRCAKSKNCGQERGVCDIYCLLVKLQARIDAAEIVLETKGLGDLVGCLKPSRRD